MSTDKGGLSADEGMEAVVLSDGADGSENARDGVGGVDVGEDGDSM